MRYDRTAHAGEIIFGIGFILAGLLIIAFRERFTDLRMRWYDSHPQWQRFSQGRRSELFGQVLGGVVVIGTGVLALVIAFH